MVTKEEMQQIVDQFNEEELKREGIFGIFHYGGLDESYISANKEGLILFALKLLKAANNTKIHSSDGKKEMIPIYADEEWINEKSEIFIQYIDLNTDRQGPRPQATGKLTIVDKLMPYGCGLGILLLVIALLVGLVTIFKWLL